MHSKQLECAWQRIFPGSRMYSDVTGRDACCVGQEDGVDLFLPPTFAAYLPTRMIQVKATFFDAFKFLVGGITRNEIIPVLIGDPQYLADPVAILSQLAAEFTYSYQGPKLDKVFEAESSDCLPVLRKYIRANGIPMRERRPAWAIDLP